MHYNLLYYGATSNQCNTSNNNINTKDGHLKKILAHVKPDIFTVNEMGCNTVYGQRILERCLNVDGETKYARTELQTGGSQNLCNMLFYNTEKVGWSWVDKMTQDGAGNRYVRSIDMHQLYFKGEYLDHGADTVRFKYIVSHLKAGNSSNDRNERAWTTQGVMDYLANTYRDGNMIFAGDLNVYNSTETGYQNLTNYVQPDYSFQDPINRPGKWNNNSSFADIHTQSTHSSNSNACFSSGGMDDRFDQILLSKSLMQGHDQMQYVDSSYDALGQDGKRYNQSINSPANTVVSTQIADALYGMSDHLPVILKLKASTSIPSSVNDLAGKTGRQFSVKRWNDNRLRISTNGPQGESWQIQISDLTGRSLYSSTFNISTEDIELLLPSSLEQAGIYLISMYSGHQWIGTQKVFLQP
ncbi:hypothetical protein KFE98_09620 [bacterium SCSIO 12741]|nr:hypothetical protein KFE98_09620 [bacterium SCSIO 12741]